MSLKSYCQNCKSDRIVEVYAKSNDLNNIIFPDGKEHEGYVPDGMNIAGGDSYHFKYCQDCGQIQGQWPEGLIILEDDEDKDEEAINIEPVEYDIDQYLDDYM